MTAQPGFKPYIAKLGNGPRPALALHCTLAFSGAWAGFARKIGNTFTLIAPDMPSHGRSDGWDGTHSFADTVFEASLQALTEPMDVIGHSFGGAIALRLAVERPDLVRTLTMIEPVFFHIARLDMPDAVQDHDLKAKPFNDTIQTGDMEAAARQFNRMWAEGPRWDDMPAQVRAAMTRAIHVVPNTVSFLYDDTANLVPRLDKAQMPAMLVRGATSLPIIKATNSGLARRLPNAQDVAVEGAGHMAPVTHPGEVAALWKGLTR